MARETDTPICIWHNNLAKDFNSHNHAAIEIILPMENWYEAVVRETPFHILPGEIFLIPSKAVHSIKAPESGSRLVFLFDLTLLSGLRGFSDIQNSLSAPLLLNRKTHPAIYDEAYRLLTQIDREYSGQQPFSDFTILSHLLELLVLLSMRQGEQLSPTPGVRAYKQKEYTEKFNSVIEYINLHYMEEVDMERIAESIGFSKYHFARLFKQMAHDTFSSYLNRRRILAAEELLRQPDLTITEVALQSGFPSIATFNRVFKQQKNCTPSKYRERNSRFR